MTVSAFTVPLFRRGQVIEDDLVPFATRGGQRFLAPDPGKHVESLSLASPVDMADLYEVGFEEILDVLEALGRALDLDSNRHLQAAYEASLVANPLSPSLLRNSYLTLGPVFGRETVREMVESQIGIDHLEGWVPHRLRDGREARVRAFGSRVLHIPAGNGALVSAVSILRSVVTRGDAIVKAPSNDPLTAVAIARTLAEVAPGHPIVRHLAVGYWKGGDVAVEEALCTPERIEKIVAWGGLASVAHVTRYIQPGLELIALDPKRSATIIGPEAFADEETLREVAVRAACDIGVANQEACASARVLYVLSGTDEAGLANLERLGELIYEALLELPAAISTKPKVVDRELLDHLEATRLVDDWYRVIGGEDGEGAVIVSRLDEPVDYSAMLSGRVANLVPVDHIDAVTRAVTAATQTIGIFPESLKSALRDRLPLFGAQRLTSLGYACNVSIATPQDAMEPMRRMCKWVVDEECDPDRVLPMWRVPAAVEP